MCVSVVPWQRKGQPHIAAGQSQQEKIRFAICFSGRDCISKPNTGAKTASQIKQRAIRIFVHVGQLEERVQRQGVGIKARKNRNSHSPVPVLDLISKTEHYLIR